MGIVEKLKTEFDFEEEWVNYELHPETPKSGVMIAEKFPDLDLEKFRSGLNSRGEQYSLRFGDFNVISNSSMALQIGELAREQGCYSRYHEKMFQSYFQDCKDIGDMQVVIEVAKKCGIDEGLTRETLESGRFAPTIERARMEATELGIKAVPTFIINDETRLVGALPLGRLKKAPPGI